MEVQCLTEITKKENWRKKDRKLLKNIRFRTGIYLVASIIYEKGFTCSHFIMKFYSTEGKDMTQKALERGERSYTKY